MSVKESAAAFTGLVDLASEGLGGRVLSSNDAFFAEADNLLKPGRGVFIEGKYTDQGKWMDGWESRRKRGPGHDHCVIALGARGRVLGFDIDINHFLGNHPPFASVDGASAPTSARADELVFRPLLSPAPLLPGSQNLFAALPGDAISHVRLNIYPDGGVARFRVFGLVEPDLSTREVDAESAAHVEPDWVDLAAVRSGGRALACSDAFFGPMNNLLLPGRAQNMGGGWETRRRRGPGHDFIWIALARRGTPRLIEVDTNYFKGNYPDRCSLDALDREGVEVTELMFATPELRALLPVTKLSAHNRHFVPVPVAAQQPATHLRLNIFPDGGVSRLRVWGSAHG